MLGFAALAHGQTQFAHIGQYSQFRNITGMSGGTVPVSPGGIPGAQGALALSTPIAYSLKGGRFIAALANNSYDRTPRFFKGGSVNNDLGVKSNGSAVLMGGISTRAGDFTVGMTVVSGAFENSYSAQFTPRQPEGRVKFAVGAQGLFAAGGFLGPGLHDDVDRATSMFGVATVDCGKGVYASAGVGTARFQQGFANVSFGLGSRFRATIEHDGFGWNYGVGYAVTEIKIGRDRPLNVHAFGGLVQSRYAFVGLGLSF
jgi:hypothetical protein